MDTSLTRIRRARIIMLLPRLCDQKARPLTRRYENIYSLTIRPLSNRQACAPPIGYSMDKKMNPKLCEAWINLYIHRSEIKHGTYSVPSKIRAAGKQDAGRKELRSIELSNHSWLWLRMKTSSPRGSKKFNDEVKGENTSSICEDSAAQT